MTDGLMRHMAKLSLAIITFTSTQVSHAQQYVTLDEAHNVTCFYGVPIKLTISGLKRLPFRVKLEHRMGEEGKEDIYKIIAKNGVDLNVEFDSGKLYLIETASTTAVGPRGIRIGSSLSDVKKAWPAGKLIYGSEEGRFVTYITGTNVLYLFDPKGVPSTTSDLTDVEMPNIKVQTIRILPRPNPVP